MRIPIAVIADYANVSLEGKLNIMGIFDRIVATAVPARHPQMQLVLVFEADPTERGAIKDVAIILMDEDGQELGRVGGPMQIPVEGELTQRINQVVRLQDFVFPRFGRYSIFVTVGGETKAEVTFAVMKLPAAPPAG